MREWESGRAGERTTKDLVWTPKASKPVVGALNVRGPALGSSPICQSPERKNLFYERSLSRKNFSLAGWNAFCSQLKWMHFHYNEAPGQFCTTSVS